MNTKCKPITESELLDLINNDEEILNSLQELGFYNDGEKLRAVLEYYELFTKEEFKRFQDKVREFYKDLDSYPYECTDKHVKLSEDLYIKLYSSEEVPFVYCDNNFVCHSCFKALQIARDKKLF